MSSLDKTEYQPFLAIDRIRSLNIVALGNTISSQTALTIQKLY